MAAFYQLVITAPAYKGVFSGFNGSWPAILPVLRKYLKGRGSHDLYGDFLSTGLPYHLPFSLEASVAKSFAADLKGAGCEVDIVPANS